MRNGGHIRAKMLLLYIKHTVYNQISHSSFFISFCYIFTIFEDLRTLTEGKYTHNKHQYLRIVELLKSIRFTTSVSTSDIIISDVIKYMFICIVNVSDVGSVIVGDSVDFIVFLFHV